MCMSKKKMLTDNIPPFSCFQFLNVLFIADVMSLCWAPSSEYLYSCGRDRHIRVWHNTPGLSELVRELKSKLPKASSEPLKVCVCVCVSSCL